jgi:hypothetical protein
LTPSITRGQLTLPKREMISVSGAETSFQPRKEILKTKLTFHGFFLRPKDFSRQNRATLRTAVRMPNSELPNVPYAVKRSENKRKNSVLNYKSAALPAELCRQKMRT